MKPILCSRCKDTMEAYDLVPVKGKVPSICIFCREELMDAADQLPNGIYNEEGEWEEW
jgi:hypothetical protein